jgi:hypothetical protein
MPDDWGATGIKFWGSPKKELKIVGFLEGASWTELFVTSSTL